jgi:CheY-like chemotaxis protein
MDGYEVARRIRASRGIRRPLLVAITGYGAPEDRQRALDAGFDAHVTKPVDYSTLIALLASSDVPTS